MTTRTAPQKSLKDTLLIDKPALRLKNIADKVEGTLTREQEYLHYVDNKTVRLERNIVMLLYLETQSVNKI